MDVVVICSTVNLLIQNALVLCECTYASFNACLDETTDVKQPRPLLSSLSNVNKLLNYVGRMRKYGLQMKTIYDPLTNVFTNEQISPISSIEQFIHFYCKHTK